MLSRRFVLCGAIAAPLLVAADRLMPLRGTILQMRRHLEVLDAVGNVLGGTDRVETVVTNGRVSRLSYVPYEFLIERSGFATHLDVDFGGLLGRVKIPLWYDQFVETGNMANITGLPQ